MDSSIEAPHKSMKSGTQQGGQSHMGSYFAKITAPEYSLQNYLQYLT